MNKELVSLLSRQPMTEATRKQALHLISKANPETSDIFGLLKDENLITNVSEIATGYVNTATAAVSHQGTWDTLIGTTEITAGLMELLKNVSLVNYTQAVMMVTIALMEDG